MPPAGLIERARLGDLVDWGVERPLTMVSAPAGWGKTRLLVQWIESRAAPGPVAWLPLRREHADPRRFWTDVVAALGAANRGLARLAPPPRGALQPFLATLLDALAEVEEPLVLVLDDLQIVADPTVHADLEWLLEGAPDRLRLVVATRSDPPMRLQRLRATERMSEVRAKDLAFTLEEAEEVLRPLDLTGDDVELLWRRTEGWATGLKLAQLSLQGRNDPRAFIEGFAGSDAAVSDYLMSEVVNREPPDALEFLLRTSVAEGLDGSLAEALTGDVSATRRLRALVRSNGFVTQVEGGVGVYRYHTLFAHVLRAELHHRLPGAEPELHRVAGRWHAEHGSPLEALRHAIAAEDWDLASEVFGEHWLGLVLRGGATALHQLARRIPEETVRADAELALGMAGLLLEEGDHESADQLLRCAQEGAAGLPEPRRRRFAVTSTATSLHRARQQGDVAGALSAAHEVLDARWDTAVATDVRAATLANLGIAEFWAGGLPAAADHLQQAAGLALECGNDFVLFLAESYIAAADSHDGRLEAAAARARTAIQLAERRGWAREAHAAIAYCTLATVHLWLDEPAEAERFAGRAAEVLERSGEPLLSAAVAQLRAHLCMLRGEPLTALDMVRGVAARGPLPPFLRVSSRMLEAELWMQLGEVGRARARLTEMAADGDHDVAIGLARLELRGGDPGAAVRAVATFLADEREPVLPYARLEAWVIDAIARDALHDEEAALRALERALDLAEPHGYAHVLSRYGSPMRSLLRRRVARGTAHRALAASLLATLGEGTANGRSPSSSSSSVLLEPLSERELVVLRFLPTMMSNAEIAAEMFVSVNTVKTHLKHVYRKLDVAGRRDCVSRARELRLLSPGLGAERARAGFG